jgi:nucleoside 2-deoxyribosyltransferase
MIIYLAGPMTGKTPEAAKAWRDHVIMELEPDGFVLTSPMRVETTYLKAKKAIAADSFGERSTIAEMRPSAIYERDMFDVRNADIILANMNDADIASLGSSHEIGYADALGRATIILVARPGNLYREHPIVAQAAGVIFDELPEAIHYIRMNYAPYVREQRYVRETAKETE